METNEGSVQHQEQSASETPNQGETPVDPQVPDEVQQEQQEQPDQQTPAEEEAPKQEAEENAQEEAEEAAEEETPENEGEDQSAGEFTLESLTERYNANDGQFSEEDYSGIQERYGLDRSEADMVAEGLKLLQEKANSTLYEIAGGEERFNEISMWAGQNLPAAEVDTLNTQFESRDLTASTMAMRSLVAQYEKENGVKPTNINTGQPAGGDKVQGYKSAREAAAATTTAEYRNDPAVRKAHSIKLAATDEAVLGS